MLVDALPRMRSTIGRRRRTTCGCAASFSRRILSTKLRRVARHFTLTAVEIPGTSLHTHVPTALTFASSHTDTDTARRFMKAVACSFSHEQYAPSAIEPTVMSYRSRLSTNKFTPPGKRKTRIDDGGIAFKGKSYANYSLLSLYTHLSGMLAIYATIDVRSGRCNAKSELDVTCDY